MRWAEAVKIWNQHKKHVNAAHVYCLPRKGTPEHAHVRHIQGGGDPAKFEHVAAPKAPEKMEAPKKFAFKNKAKEEKEARVAETGKRLKSEKVKAFLKAALERRRAKKESENEKAAEKAVAADVKKGIAKDPEFLSQILQAFGGYSKEKADKAAAPKPAPTPVKAPPKPVPNTEFEAWRKAKKEKFPEYRDGTWKSDARLKRMINAIDALKPARKFTPIPYAEWTKEFPMSYRERKSIEDAPLVKPEQYERFVSGGDDPYLERFGTHPLTREEYLKRIKAKFPRGFHYYNYQGLRMFSPDEKGKITLAPLEHQVLGFPG